MSYKQQINKLNKRKFMEEVEIVSEEITKDSDPIQTMRIEFEAYQKCLENETTVDNLIRDSELLEHYRNMFGTKIVPKTKLCNRKSCGKMHFTGTGKNHTNFCSVNCEKIYKKK